MSMSWQLADKSILKIRFKIKTCFKQLQNNTLQVKLQLACQLWCSECISQCSRLLLMFWMVARVLLAPCFLPQIRKAYPPVSGLWIQSFIVCENCMSDLVNGIALFNKQHDLSRSSMNGRNLEPISMNFKLRVSVLLCLSSNVQHTDATATI